MPGRWRTKSRSGCRACKARKVKCDEYRPSCRNCARRGVKCDFLEQPLPAPQTDVGDVSLELELLHNWTIATSSTFATEPRVRDLWRVLVPQIGFSTKYILDSILALSALHMARFDVARRDTLIARATQYHVASLNGASPLLSNVTSQNCNHLFLFGLLTLYTNLASPKQEQDLLVVGNGAIPQWLLLLRGLDVLIEVEGEAINSSAMSLIFRSTGTSAEFWGAHSPAEHQALSDLQAGVCRRTNGDQKRQAILMNAVADLRRSYTFLTAVSFSHDERLTGIYSWLFHVSGDFLQLVKEVDSEALCVFAFFAVLVKELERYWWVEGWSLHLIRRIYNVLDDEYRLCIRWPIEELGWIPQSTFLK